MKQASVLKAFSLTVLAFNIMNSVNGMKMIGNPNDKDIGIRVQNANQTINVINKNIEQLKQRNKPLEVSSAIEWLNQIDDANEQLFKGFPLNKVRELLEGLNPNKKIKTESHSNQKPGDGIAITAAFSLLTPKACMESFYENRPRIGKGATATVKTCEQQLDQILRPYRDSWMSFKKLEEQLWEMLTSEQTEIVKQEISKKGQKKFNEMDQKIQSTIEIAAISEKLIPQLDSDIKELCRRGLARLADQFNNEHIRLTQSVQMKSEKLGIVEATEFYAPSIRKLCENVYRLVHNPNIGDIKLLSEHMQNNIKLLAESAEQDGNKAKAEGYILRLNELSANRDKELQQFKERKSTNLSELEGICKKHYNLLKVFYEELFEYRP